jgi:hypothetical protein
MGAKVKRNLEQLLAQLPDPRGFQGRDHRLPSIIMLIILGKLCGEKSMAGIQRFGRLLSKAQKAKLGFRKHNTPALGTLTETMKAVDADALQGILSQAMHKGKVIQHLSIDGKTIRGSKSAEHPATHCVSVFCDALTAVIGQVSSRAKGLEIPDAFRLLASIDLKGVVVTGDAMFTQASITEIITEKGGHYIFPLKNNQKSLKEAVELTLNDPLIQKKTPVKPRTRIMDDWSNAT